MQPIYEPEPNNTSPLMKWGINVSKMRRKAFESYRKNYNEALEKWPEFKQEYDHIASIRKEAISKRSDKEVQSVSFLGKKNFFKYLLYSK
jgi:hypothetical protein